MPAWGETVLASHFETSFGGKGANQAVAAAKLGAEVVMVTNLGDDTLGDSALKNFESYGIDTRHVRRIPNQSTGTATILVDEKSGDNSILIVAGANGDLSSADVDAASEALKACDLILLQLEIQLETAYEAIRFARKQRRQDRAEPGACPPQPRHGRRHAGELSRPQRIRARDPDRHGRGVGRRGLSRRAKPGEAGRRNGHRDAWRARFAAGDARRLADASPRSRFRPSTRPAPATPSSAASPAISPAASRSRRRSSRRPAIPPSQSPATARRNPIRPRPSSLRSAPDPGEGSRANGSSPCAS